MLAHGIFFLAFIHFFQFTLAVPNPANGVSPRDPIAPTTGAGLATIPRDVIPRADSVTFGGTLICEVTSGSPLFTDIEAACLDGWNTGSLRADHSGSGCNFILSHGQAEFGVCGDFEGTRDTVATYAQIINYQCQGSPDGSVRSGGRWVGPNGNWDIRVYRAGGT